MGETAYALENSQILSPYYATAEMEKGSGLHETSVYTTHKQHTEGSMNHFHPYYLTTLLVCTMLQCYGFCYNGMYKSGTRPNVIIYVTTKGYLTKHLLVNQVCITCMKLLECSHRKEECN